MASSNASAPQKAATGKCLINKPNTSSEPSGVKNSSRRLVLSLSKYQRRYNPRKSAQKISANQRETEQRLLIKFTISIQSINLALLPFTLSLETCLFKLGSFSTGVNEVSQCPTE
jgi:hypothetical protein